MAFQIVAGRETAVAGRNAIVVAKGTATLVRGTRLVKIALTSAGRRVLRNRRSLTVTVLARARDAAGNDGTAIAEGKIRR